MSEPTIRCIVGGRGVEGLRVGVRVWGMNPSSWSEIAQIVADRGLDITPAHALVDQLRTTRIIDPEAAVGDTVLSHLRMGASVDEAVAVAKALALESLAGS